MSAGAEMTAFVPKFEVSVVADSDERPEGHMPANGDHSPVAEADREPQTPFIVSLPSEGLRRPKPSLENVHDTCLVLDDGSSALVDRNQMFLFSEDEDRRVSSLLSRLANYDDAIQPIAAEDGTLPLDAKPAQKKANLGVLTGVYLPCIQNIFGVIIFIRMTWMTGTAGVPAFFFIVLLCCSVTFCTVSLTLA